MNRTDLVYQLKAAFDGEDVTEIHAEVGGIKGVYEPETNTIRFVMNGTNYTMVDLANAIDWLDKQIFEAGEDALTSKYLHISKCAIKALLEDFTAKETTFTAAVKVGREKTPEGGKSKKDTHTKSSSNGKMRYFS